jgi:predicted AlkP superfamily phosphohydrolase/phosphomutase
VATHYLDNEEWDLFFYVFSETHCVGHQCWSLHDTTDPRHDPEIVDALGGDPLLEIYESLDAAIGEVISRAGPDTTTLVLFSHGIGPRRTGNHILDDILWELDRSAATPTKGRKAIDGMLRSGWHKVPAPLKRAGMKVLKKAPVTTTQLGLGPTWGDLATRRAFKVSNNDTWGGVRINLVGREPAGTVQESEYDSVCEDITQGLLELVNEDTGEPAIVRVVKTRDVYAGEQIDRLPDLLVEWNRNALISNVTSPRIGKVHGIDEHCRSGDHREAGLLLATGPHVVPGEHEPIPIEAIAPTIAALLDSSIPEAKEAPIPPIAGAGDLASTPG